MLKIRVNRNAAYQWVAFSEEHFGIWEIGNTEAEAVGKLIIMLTSRGKSGIQIIKG